MVARDEWQYFRVEPPDLALMTVRLRLPPFATLTMDADLFVSTSHWPTRASYDFKSDSYGSDSLASIHARQLFVGVVGYSQLASFTLDVSWTLLVPGCDGVNASGRTYDACGVCGGTNASCVGCDGVPNSRVALDKCGLCGGNGSRCEPCINGTERYDRCGLCGGDDSSCLGCDLRPASGAKVDMCGVCGGDNTTCVNCKCSDTGISGDQDTYTAGCQNHFGDENYWCYVVDGTACRSARASLTVARAAWKTCMPIQNAVTLSSGIPQVGSVAAGHVSYYQLPVVVMAELRCRSLRGPLPAVMVARGRLPTFDDFDDFDAETGGDSLYLPGNATWFVGVVGYVDTSFVISALRIDRTLVYLSELPVLVPEPLAKKPQAVELLMWLRVAERSLEDPLVLRRMTAEIGLKTGSSWLSDPTQAQPNLQGAVVTIAILGALARARACVVASRLGSVCPCLLDGSCEDPCAFLGNASVLNVTMKSWTNIRSVWSQCPEFSPPTTSVAIPGAQGTPDVQPACPSSSSVQRMVSATTGTITNGPGDYGPNILCGWDIQPSLMDGRATCIVEITFVEMSVEQEYDYVTLWDGGPLEQGGQLLSRLSGSLPNRTLYRSSACRLYVEFRSDSSMQMAGFAAFYSVFYPVIGNNGSISSPQLITSAPGRLPTSASTWIPTPALPVQSPSANFSMRADNASAQRACSGMYQLNVSGNGSGMITSGPTGYSPDSDCAWLIRASCAITIRFELFATEAAYDVLRVYDSRTLLLSLSGIRTQIASVQARSGTMRLRFTSDSTIQVVCLSSSL